MKRTLFRILAFPLPTRSMRNYVRRLGGPRIVPPSTRIINMLRAAIDISTVPPAHGFLRYVKRSGEEGRRHGILLCGRLKRRIYSGQ